MRRVHDAGDEKEQPLENAAPDARAFADGENRSGGAAQQKAMKKAWESFVRGEYTGGVDVPEHIMKGWLLSRNYGVNPTVPSSPPVLSARELEKLRQANASLLEAAGPMLEMLAVSIRDTGYIATLAISSGHLLEVVGDSELMDEARASYNLPGAVRSVQNVGSSALSLSIMEKRPVLVTGYEHYSCSFHRWRCAAAPIFDPSGNPIASLTISCRLGRRDIHTLTLARSCAHGIRVRLREQELLRNQNRLNAMLKSMQDSLPEALFSIDNEGRITHANRKASVFFGAGEEAVGKTLARLFSKAELPRVNRIVMTGQSANLEMEVLAESGPMNALCRFMPVFLEDGTPGGMTVGIGTKGQMLDLAKRVAGNYAKYSFEDIKGESAPLKQQIELARKAAASDHRILLYGESGTGKELFAQSVHNASPRRNGPFVAISCAAIPRDLIESELFGYVGGAFTGARRDGMVGKLELATGGTLFLDEINSLPLDMQAKLLRVLQQLEIVRIGDTKPTPIDVRVIAATNQDLREAVHRGDFREDLYFRLNVVEIEVPPLRRRKDDIGLLAHVFLRRQSGRSGTPFYRMTAKAQDALYSYAWPGNVRELENVCERALLLAADGIVDVHHLPPSLMQAGLSSQEREDARQGSVDGMYRQLLVDTLAANNGNISKAAEQMGVARSTLYRKMRAFGM